MTSFDLEDHEVEIILQQLQDTSLQRAVAQKIEGQIPKEEPLLIGALVLTQSGKKCLRWSGENDVSHYPWIWLDNELTPSHISLVHEPIAQILAPGYVDV